jgi:hypothetical protein
MSANRFRAYMIALAVLDVLGVTAGVSNAPVQAAGDQASAPGRDSGRGHPNRGVVPNQGHIYGNLGPEWWQWAFSFPAADVPILNTGGHADISAGQSGHVWFLAGRNSGDAATPPGAMGRCSLRDVVVLPDGQVASREHFAAIASRSTKHTRGA